MSANSLDERAREAARAARVSVLPLEQALLSSDVRRRHGTTRRMIALVAVAAMLVTGIAVLAIDRRDAPSDVATGPPTQGSVPPPPSVPPIGPSEKVLATGMSRQGQGWTLYEGGPSNDLCLAVQIAEPRIFPSVCAGRPGGAPVPPGARYIPLLMDDTRAPAFVFGRMPPNVQRVELRSFGGEQLGQSGVIDGPGGPFYVIELATRTMPDLVIGSRADGTSVSYSAFCLQAPRPDAEVPESYVGSLQHRSDLGGLAFVAPAAIAEDIRRVQKYVEANVRPENPDSQLVEKWPADVRAAAERVQRFITENCD